MAFPSVFLKKQRVVLSSLFSLDATVDRPRPQDEDRVSYLPRLLKLTHILLILSLPSYIVIYVNFQNFHYYVTL